MTPERDQQIMDVFLAATELPHDRRVAYLHTACDTDAALRAEVDSLLTHHVPDTLVETDGRDSGNRVRPGRNRVTTAAAAGSEFPHTAVFRRSITAAITLVICSGSLWYITHHTIRNKLRQNVESQLRTVLNADIAAVELWLSKQKQMARNWAEHNHVRATLQELARLSSEQKLSTSDLEATETHARFLEVLSPVQALREVTFIGAFARDGHAIAKFSEPRVSDVYWSSRGAALIAPCFRGETVFMPTFRRGSNVVGADHSSIRKAVVSIVAPVRSVSGEVIAAMQFIMEIDKEFAALFSMAQLGATGDSYAFDNQGIVLTGLREENDLKELQLIPGDGGAALNLQLRDPGIDLRHHPLAVNDLTTRPLCSVPRVTIAHGDAINADGYRNYLGVWVVGAAEWLPEYDFGVATEIGYDEAYGPLQSVTWVFGVVFSLFAGAAAVATVMWIVNQRLRKQVTAARCLGQYTLGMMIGQGGMASVYKATHSVLRRPTAIKLIEQREAGDEMVARFEREVQLASELTHPNTIQIYDYGQTDDGVFYFAMEFLQGISLADLVIREGPLPAARVVNILRQVCASLAEAHSKGLIHRDIKPANIMLCERGGLFDFVKVLDFGLARRLAAFDDPELTGHRDLAGTPFYIAPERIRNPNTLDTRSDVYSLGTVAFLLLTGTHPFDGQSSMDILFKIMNEEPLRASEVTGHEVPERLDELVSKCLAKDPDGRPQHMGRMIEVLESLQADFPWTQTDARLCWQRLQDSADQETALISSP